MRYCPNCGSPLPDAAKFCMECGTPTPSAPAPHAPTVPQVSAASQAPAAPHASVAPQAPVAPQVPDAPQAPEKPQASPAPAWNNAPPRRARTGLIIGLAIGAVVIIAALVVLLVLLIGGKGETALPAEKNTASISRTDSIDMSASKKSNSDTTEETTDETADEPNEQQPEQTEEESLPPYNAQGIEVAEITTLLNAYKNATDAVIDATTDDFAAECSRGNLYDYDGDGYPELVLLYSLDGIALESVIFRRTDDSAEPRCLQKELWAGMAGGAAGSIYSGTLDTGESVIFLEATNWEGETKVGRDYVYSLANTDIEYLYHLEWYADIDGNLINCWVFDANDELLSQDNVEQFMSIYDAREYYEATYPSDQHGELLADLFSDEAMDSYYQ